MKKTLQRMEDKGFTLVELIIVIAIMAILAGAIAPAVIRYIDKARLGKFTSDAKTVLDDAQADYVTYFSLDDDDPAFNNGAPTSIGQIDGVDCDKVYVSDDADALDLDDVDTPSKNAIFYVNPKDGQIVACVYNNGRYTGYWKNTWQTGEWKVRKN